jgi:hypothetical protein
LINKNYIAKLLISINYEEIKTMADSLKLSSFFLLIKKIWKNLSNIFFSNNELKIWQKRDRFGNIYWQAYNPYTRNFVCFASEMEVRIWIEQQLYR